MSIQQQLQFLKNISPFSQLPTPLLTQAAQALDVVYFQMHETFHIQSSENAYLFFIIKGRISEFDAENRHQATYGLHSFLGESVLLKQTACLNYQVEEEAILYRLPQVVFSNCLQEAEFQSFFIDDITTKLNKYHNQLQAESSGEMMMASVAQAPLNKALRLPDYTDIQSCVKQMHTQQTDACIVDNTQGEQGIVTITDLVNALALYEAPLSSPIGPWAKFPVITVDQFDFLFNALLKMTHHHINRLAVRSDSNIIGFLHQKELMSLFANQSGLVSFSIQQANDLPSLKTCSEQIETLISSLVNRGVKTHYIAKLVNTLHQKIIQKVIQLVDQTAQLHQACFIVMGSEGRSEQVLRTDQDNALLLPDHLNIPPQELQRLTQSITDALIYLGFPPCPGNIMVCNPVWAKTLGNFKSTIKDWLRAPNDQAFINLSIFVDAQAVYGDENLLQAAKNTLQSLISGHPHFLVHFAKSALQFETPVSILGNLVSDKHHQEPQIDLKKGGIFPIVHGVRCLAMEQGITQTNTHWRIKALMDKGILSQSFGFELGETLNYLNTLRLEAMLALKQTGKPLDNFIRLNQLTPAQQNLLKASFGVVNRFKKRLEHHFQIHRVL